MLRAQVVQRVRGNCGTRHSSVTLENLGGSFRRFQYESFDAGRGGECGGSLLAVREPNYIFRAARLAGTRNAIARNNRPAILDGSPALHRRGVARLAGARAGPAKESLCSAGVGGRAAEKIKNFIRKAYAGAGSSDRLDAVKLVRE